MKDFWLYTGARFGIFALVYAVIIGAYLIVSGPPIPILWPLLVAGVGSAVLSSFLLRDMRERVAGTVQSRAERMTQRFEEMRAKEDTD